ncbi:MAG: hypothetical protein R3F59_21230 [Myxococcota bacterium]
MFTELAAFDQWVGTGRVEVTSVGFTEFDDRDGNYDGAGIQLLRDLPAGHVREVVRHELCHALEHAEGLRDQPGLAELGARLEAANRYDRPWDDARWRGEAFAKSCERDPYTNHLLLTACPGDDPLVNEIASWIEAVVWTHFDPSPRHRSAEASPSRSRPLLCHPVDRGGRLAHGRPRRAHRHAATSDGPPDLWSVERATGALSDGRPDAAPPLPPVTTLVPPLYGGLEPVDGYDGGPYLARQMIWIDGSTWHWRYLWSADGDEPGGWLPIGDGCTEPVNPFFVDRTAYLADFDGDAVTWTPLGTR